VSKLLIGYARVSTDAQDLTAQRDGLQALGIPPERMYVDHGLTGTHRDRPGLREALAACRAGDTLVVTKLDRLARSLPDARDIVDDLTKRGVKLNLGGSVHDPTDPVGRLLFNVLAMIAEFEADLIRARTREGMKVAKAKGRLRGKQPKLTSTQEAHLVELDRAGTYTSAELAELFSVARSTVYRAIQRQPYANRQLDVYFAAGDSYPSAGPTCAAGSRSCSTNQRKKLLSAARSLRTVALDRPPATRWAW
jgi:DNA invertase Pin-like site-specific DNA recombinase